MQLSEQEDKSLDGFTFTPPQVPESVAIRRGIESGELTTMHKTSGHVGIRVDGVAPTMTCKFCGAEVTGRKNRRIHEMECYGRRKQKTGPKAVEQFIKNNPELIEKLFKKRD